MPQANWEAPAQRGKPGPALELVPRAVKKPRRITAGCNEPSRPRRATCQRLEVSGEPHGGWPCLGGPGTRPGQNGRAQQAPGASGGQAACVSAWSASAQPSRSNCAQSIRGPGTWFTRAKRQLQRRLLRWMGRPWRPWSLCAVRAVEVRCGQTPAVTKSQPARSEES